MPALHKDSLAQALIRLDALPLDKGSKALIGDILKSASNEHSERIDVIIKTLEPDRRKMVLKTAKQVSGVTRDVLARGRAGLEDMSEDEWATLQGDE